MGPLTNKELVLGRKLIWLIAKEGSGVRSSHHLAGHAGISSTARDQTAAAPKLRDASKLPRDACGAPGIGHARPQGDRAEARLDFR